MSFMRQPPLINAHSEMQEMMGEGKRYFWSYMSFLYKRYIAKLSTHDPKLSALMVTVEWENYHYFYVEIRENCYTIA